MNDTVESSERTGETRKQRGSRNLCGTTEGGVLETCMTRERVVRNGELGVGRSGLIDVEEEVQNPLRSEDL